MKKIYSILFYLFYSLIIFLPIISSTGIPMSGDWSLPYGTTQTQTHFLYFSNAWYNIIATGARNIATSFFPVALIMKLMFFLGVNTLTYSKFVLPLITTVSGYSMYSLLRYLKIKKIASLLGGLIYITSPLFFNYSILGWIYILFFISALLPLATKYFLLALNERKTKYIIITAIIFSISSIQAQAIVIFPMVFVIVGLLSLKSISDLKYMIKSMLLMMVIFFCLTAYWLPGLIAIPEVSITGSNIVESSVSVGTSENQNLINILRLFGSLYNFQFETIIGKLNLLVISSFVLPLLAITSLLINKYKKESVMFWLIGLIPLFTYFLNQNREIFSLIPYSNVFRDLSRFSVLSTFAYAVLASISLNFLIFNHKRVYKLILFGTTIFLIIFSYPWWGGELLNWKGGEGRDVRLRMYEVNQDYLNAEKYLSEENNNFKALYIPTGGYISFPENKQFYGEYKEMQDIFALFSPISGSLAMNDKNLNDPFLNKINSNLSGNLIDTLRTANYKFIVIRDDATIINKEKIVDNLNNNVKSGSLKQTYKNSSVTIYEITNTTPLINAHFFQQNKELTKNISFIQKNSSQYLININNIDKPFLLEFNEQFHSQWKIYMHDTNILKLWSSTQIIEDKSHKIVNDFANSWYIDPATVCQNNYHCINNDDGTYSFTLDLEFFPQRIFYVGLSVSSLSLIVCVYYIIRRKKNFDKKKNEK